MPAATVLLDPSTPPVLVVTAIEVLEGIRQAVLPLLRNEGMTCLLSGRDLCAPIGLQ